MSFELIHTSVEKALRGGAGFATAVATEGMPPGLEPVLAELSAFEVDSARASGADEVDWCHRIVTLQGRSYTVLSRVSACGPDWSGRPNRVAHHLVADAAERSLAGPAWTLANFRYFATGVPAVEHRRSGPTIPSSGTVGPRVATNWSSAGFDPGWAGVVAASLLDGGGATIYLVLPSGSSTLALVEDVFALLPADRRWNCTFSTRYQRVPASVRCQLRCVRAGAPGVANLLAEPGCRKIVVTSGGSAGDTPAAEAARAGREVTPTIRTVSARIEPVKLPTPVHVEPIEPVHRQQPAARAPEARPRRRAPDLTAIAMEARAISPRPSDPSRSELRAVWESIWVDYLLFAFAIVLLVLALIVYL